jgi:hypothetical protein
MDTTKWTALYTVFEVINKSALDRLRTVEKFLTAVERATPVDLRYLNLCLNEIHNRRCVPLLNQSCTFCISALSYKDYILETLNVQTIADLIVAKGYWVKLDCNNNLKYLHVAWVLPTDLEGYIIPQRVVEPLCVDTTVSYMFKTVPSM